MQDFLKINDNDNVVVALNTIPAGEKITVSVGDGQKTVIAKRRSQQDIRWLSVIFPRAARSSNMVTVSVMPRRTSQRAAGSILIM